MFIELLGGIAEEELGRGGERFGVVVVLGYLEKEVAQVHEKGRRRSSLGAQERPDASLRSVVTVGLRSPRSRLPI